MLILGVALGVLLGGLGLWLIVQSAERKKQQERDRVEVTRLLTSAEDVVSEHLGKLSAQWQATLSSRLATIFDDPDCSPIDAASAMWDDAQHAVENARTTVAKDLGPVLKPLSESARNLGAKETFDQSAERSISSRIGAEKDKLTLVYLNELQSLNDDELPSVTQNHPRKLCNLGIAYASGSNGSQDLVKAESLLRRSAMQGYIDAQYLLGLMYYSGEGVSQNFSEAMRWIEPAAMKGHESAENCLGLMYLNGQGAPRNCGRALELFRLSAENGSPEAHLNIGKMYCGGEGIARDYVQGLTWLLLAEAKGADLPTGYIAAVTKNMTQEQVIEAERAAIRTDRRVFEGLLRNSHDSVADPLPMYYDAPKLADYFARAYLDALWNNHIWMVLPQPEELRAWSISDDEVARCKEEAMLVAAMGLIITVRKNKEPGFASKFMEGVANYLLARLSWQGMGDVSAEAIRVIDNYIEALESGRVVDFAAAFTGRVFSGNPNESTIFAKNFWDRSLAVELAMMNASKELLTWCVAIEMKGEIVETANVSDIDAAAVLGIVRARQLDS